MSISEIPPEYVEAFKEKYPEFVGKFFEEEWIGRFEFVGYQASNFYHPIWYKIEGISEYYRTSTMAMHLTKGIVIGYSDGTTQTIGGKGA
jgi:hypothetical protein